MHKYWILSTLGTPPRTNLDLQETTERAAEYGVEAGRAKIHWRLGVIQVLLMGALGWPMIIPR